MASACECKEYFDTIAPEWDAMRQEFFSTAVRDRALACAGVETGKTVLDVGAGSGFICRGLAARGLKVIAVDQSARMLAELAKDLPEVDCRVGQAEHLPVADREVDFVFANMYLHHVPEPEVALAEMVRVLRPGGMLVVTDLDEHDFLFLRREQHDRWLGFSRPQVAAWLTAAGLQGVAVQSIDENCCASSCSCGDKARISIFLASGTKAGSDLG